MPRETASVRLPRRACRESTPREFDGCAQRSRAYGDFLVGQAAREHLKHFAFARRKRLREFRRVERDGRLCRWKHGVRLPQDA